MSVKNSELSRREEIRQFLFKYADGRYRNSVVEFLPDSGLHIIFISGEIQPFSDKAKSMLERRVFTDVGLTVQVAQFSQKTDANTSAALHQVIEPILKSNLIEIGVSTPTESTAEVIIFVRDLTLGLPHLAAVKSKTSDFLKIYDLSLEKCFLNELADGIPSHFQILRIIYTFSPVTLELLQSKLEAEQIAAPSLRWLKRQTDQLIRESMILWQKPGNFVITALGTAMLPARKGRGSPDVKRALDLARRKW